MNFLLTNDDGIDAPGLRVLLECMEELGQVFTVAPNDHLSGCGHQVTSRYPIKVERLKSSQINELGRWAVHGTPVDCVRIAAKALSPENGFKIDWVLSGINAGGNLGVDIYTSGTVAASREAAILGLPSLALSHHINGKSINWELAKIRTIPVIKNILDRPQTKGNYWNINLPQTLNQNSTLVTLRCPMDINPVSLEFSKSIDGKYINKGIYQKRPKTLGSDVATCFDGKISITELSL
tara:strand:+ start:340 stop:1053 length:714 start_codon:yes stop_codon:yes gene_type:complete